LIQMFADVRWVGFLPPIFSSGWKTTLPTSVFFLLTSVFLPCGTMLTAFYASCYGCSRMSDGLVYTHLF
jgi:hypothetical protein